MQLRGWKQESPLRVLRITVSRTFVNWNRNAKNVASVEYSLERSAYAYVTLVLMALLVRHQKELYMCWCKDSEKLTYMFLASRYW